MWTCEWDINITAISPIIQRHSTHTKSHCRFSCLPSNRSRRYTSLIFFNWILPVKSPQDSHITRTKVSYSLTKTQPLPSTPAYGHEFYVLAFHLHPTFAAPLVRSAFKIRSEVCGGVFLWKQSTCLDCWLFMQRSSIIYVWQLCLKEVSTTGITQGNLELLLSPNSPD